jgi:two-component system, NarL family, sensor kinase
MSRAGGRTVTSATRQLVPFLGAGLAAMLLVGLGASALLARTYRHEELDDAEAVGAGVAQGPVQAGLSDGVLTGNAAALALLDRVVRREVLGKVVVAVKLRMPNGPYVYSSDPGVVGTDPPLDSTDTKPLRVGGTSGDFSSLTEPDDAPERALGVRLIEVYVAVHTPSGRPLLLETYVAFSAVRSVRGIFVGSLPALAGALVLLEAVQLPLALALLRRVQRAERRRDELFEQAMSASETARQRIAGDLHDGVVQDLAGLNYTLTQLADRAGAGGDDDAVATLRQAATTTRRSIQALRNLLIDLYPTSLHDEGLSPALHDLVAANMPGATSTIWVEPSLELSDGGQALIYRAVQEAVRNAAQHSGALTVDVKVAREGNAVVLEVVDDGRGFAPDPAGSAVNGHLGLRLLASLAAGAGGRLDVASAPGEGTRVRLEVPA